MSEAVTDRVRISGTEDWPFEGYLATPSSSYAAPGVVILQEIFGISPFIRRVADWLASEGFTALAPDLFWREQPGLEFDGNDPRQAAKGRETALSIGFEQMTEDAALAAAFLKTHPGCNGKAGHIGYCLGGAVAYRAATTPECDAAVSYYGTRMHTMLELAPAVRAPLMLHVAMSDSLCPPDAQAAIHEAFKGREDVIIHDYEGAQHAFAREEAEGYDATHAALANERTLAFLRQHLG